MHKLVVLVGPLPPSLARSLAGDGGWRPASTSNLRVAPDTKNETQGGIAYFGGPPKALKGPFKALYI